MNIQIHKYFLNFFSLFKKHPSTNSNTKHKKNLINQNFFLIHSFNISTLGIKRKSITWLDLMLHQILCYLKHKFRPIWVQDQTKRRDTYTNVQQQQQHHHVGSKLVDQVPSVSARMQFLSLLSVFWPKFDFCAIVTKLHLNSKLQWMLINGGWMTLPTWENKEKKIVIVPCTLNQREKQEETRRWTKNNKIESRL